MKMQFYRRGVYGKVNIYPAGSPWDFNWEVLSGQKTISEKQLKAIQALGFELEEIMDPGLKNLINN